MNYSEALEKIDSLQVFGSRPGLERVRELLHLMGDPQKDLYFVHVAGTNGKGSVCNMLASVLTTAKYKTGLFTSPHITGFNERIRIDGVSISDEELVALVEKYFPLVEKLRAEGKIITEFEFVTAIAFAYFDKMDCDIVVLETGLGGRLDATNVVENTLCSVITSLSLDHTAVLGDTLEDIAREKAGIIKKKCKVVYDLQNDVTDRIVTDAAVKNDCSIYLPTAGVYAVDSDYHGSTVCYNGVEFFLPLAGDHQVMNLRLVIAAVSALCSQHLSITDEELYKGISSVSMPARFEILSESPLIIADGAHNPGGLQALADTVDDLLYNYDIVCVLGMLRDKDCRTAFSAMQDVVSKLITTTVPDNPRSQTAEELARKLDGLCDDITSCEDIFEAIDTAVEYARKNKGTAVLICGSLYLVSALREYTMNNLA